ncbi:hypothetical protein CIB48_g11589 [Xylaria polymorpha]|nr:hypothetical protein CIB48_g11589 [Xylaria polymorpha]
MSRQMVITVNSLDKRTVSRSDPLHDEVVFQSMTMHIAIAEPPTYGRKVKSPYHLIDLNSTLNAVTSMPLLVKFLGVVPALALLDTFALTEGPRCL